MAAGPSSLYIKRDVEGHRAQYSGSAPGIATGTFINWGTSQQAVCANAHSGTGQVPAAGFALMGQLWGTWTTKTAEHFDIIDSPTGIGQVNSGVYTVGRPLYLSGTGLTNFSTTPPNNHGDIVQQVGVMVDDPNSGITGSSRRFRISIGQPFVHSGTGSAGILRPFVTPGALS